MSKKSTFIEIHVIQTVPPSNLNRDENGSPKTGVFGGVRRARVSSQSWKKAARDTFAPEFKGVRTRNVIDIIARILTEKRDDLGEDAKEIALQALETVKVVKVTSKKVDRDKLIETGDLQAVQFLTAGQLTEFGNLVAEFVDLFPVEVSKEQLTDTQKKDLEARIKSFAARAKCALKDGITVDVALFGRMFANLDDLNVDATSQVAHAISVHAVDNEFDNWTATSDEKSSSRSGNSADGMGTTEFNSSTLYRYANIDITHLAERLRGGLGISAEEGATAFIQGFITSMPTGMQNSFANRTVPDAVVIAVREGQPVNLVTAFEDAVVEDSDRSRAQITAERLAAEFGGVKEFLPVHKAAWVVRSKDAYAPLDGVENAVRTTLVTAISSAVETAVSGI